MNKAITKNELFGQLDFKKIANDPDFKEDSVREVMIMPILKELGYIHENPVNANLVKNAINYRFSSAMFYETGLDEFGILSNYEG